MLRNRNDPNGWIEDRASVNGSDRFSLPWFTLFLYSNSLLASLFLFLSVPCGVCFMCGCLVHVYLFYYFRLSSSSLETVYQPVCCCLFESGLSFAKKMRWWWKSGRYVCIYVALIGTPTDGENRFACGQSKFPIVSNERYCFEIFNLQAT